MGAYDRTALVANPARQRGCGGAEMGEQRSLARREQHSLATRTSPDPSWATVIRTTVRLWWQRRTRRRPPRHHRAVLVLSATGAMALGALVTLAFTYQGGHTQKPPSVSSPDMPSALTVAAANRSQAADWIAQQVLPRVLIGCDPLMCQALEAANVSATRLSVLQPSASDPLGVEVIVATPALRSQFGPRLAAVYAPLLMASFGSGAQRIDIRYLAPGGTAAFEASLASARRARVDAGQQLLNNKNVQASAQARSALLAGNVDPRLLITLGLLVHEMPVRLIVFDDPSPGVSSEIPLRGAEIGASASAGLSAMLAFLAQQTTYQPSQYHEVRIAGNQILAMQYDAPGPMGLDGP